MENKIHKYLDRIDKLKDKVESNSEKVLKRIDLDELLREPSRMFTVYAKAFYDGHSNELLKAIQIGKKHAKEMLK